MTVRTSDTVIPGKRLSPRDSAVVNDMLMDKGTLKLTLYCSGNKMMIAMPTEVDMPTMDSITTSGSRVQSILLPDDKVWYVLKLPPASTKWTHNLVTNVKDMGKTKTLLGYKAHLYKTYAKSSMMTTVGYVWIAPGVQIPPCAVGKMVLTTLQGKLFGALMSASYVQVVPSLRLRTASTYVTTSLSTAAIPATMFAIPATYKKVASQPIPTK
jgi:hypothetical protein